MTQDRCLCRKCIDAQPDPEWTLGYPYMILCPDCGNKRCPKATDHELACTKSNEPGQPGSAYATPAPQTLREGESV